MDLGGVSPAKIGLDRHGDGRGVILAIANDVVQVGMDPSAASGRRVVAILIAVAIDVAGLDVG